ncbi:hypothetical protein FACS189437_04320 [Bacteroidia bacterium]|nr:hypothetical protein FACS189437_04320 [Bacteroidia bacterium]
MKTIHLLIAGIVWVLFANTSIAQTTISNDSIEKVEKEYKGETYVINSSSRNTLRSDGNNQRSASTFIVNKNEGELKGHSAAGGCYGLKETIPLEEVIKKAISKKKITLLSLNEKNKMAIFFYYNIKTGKVINIQFILMGNTPLSKDIDSETEITLKDINTLEALFKEYYFDVPKNCVNRETGDIYGNWARVFWFSKLAEEKE